MKLAMMLSILKAVFNGYTYDPGDSDLDDEQPISVSITLGDYRKVTRLLKEWDEDAILF